jgi:hypothetical protein
MGSPESPDTGEDQDENGKPLKKFEELARRLLAVSAADVRDRERLYKARRENAAVRAAMAVATKSQKQT